MTLKDFPLAREKMVREQLSARGIKDERVLGAMRRIPRHLFLDQEIGPIVYSDHAFPIGYAQTMTQPFMVAYLAESLELKGREIVLEIGTGSGYQAAVLAALAGEVYSIERIKALATRASTTLSKLGIQNVYVRSGDGAAGWIERAPFDRILITAAASEIPRALLEQLKPGGIFIAPIERGDGRQEVVKATRRCDGFALARLRECSFVPLVREKNGGSGAFPTSGEQR